MRKLYTWITLAIFTVLMGSQVPSPPPPGAMEPYFNGIFPSLSPTGTDAYGLVDINQDLQVRSPLKIVEKPNSDRVFVLTKAGDLFEMSFETGYKKQVLDISSRNNKLGDGGSVGIALHPRFGDMDYPDKQLAFIYYKASTTPDTWTHEAYNRLSKFTYDHSNQTFIDESEEILIQQYDRSPWHDGGGLTFDEEGFLYLSVGDEGYDEFQQASNQRLDGGFFNGLLRIDIDNDSSRSHPIRRQPKANAAPPDGWWPTFSQGYMIPNDNPWQNENGEILEEFYAIGLRSPYTLHKDPNSDYFWVADVGSSKAEEINILTKGDNCQWPYIEGRNATDIMEKPDPLIGKDREPYHTYSRDFGYCIIGGGIYEGVVHSQLNGRYLFGDYVANKIVSLSNNGGNGEPEINLIIENIGTQPITLPAKYGVTGIHNVRGEIYITVLGEDSYVNGGIYKLEGKSEIADPPALLSSLGVFKDLNTLDIVDGFVPYTVNSPLWSDGAVKKRWVGVPNDGEHDQANEQIQFSKDDSWTFPSGTVFVKHFDLPMTTDPDGPLRKIETRFFIIDKNGNGYGLTYKWNDEQTDATLLGSGQTKNFTITEDGEPVFVQRWDYPSRDQCLTCHNKTADYVLGVRTHQLNAEITDDAIPYVGNQLDYWNELNLFANSIGASSSLPKSYDIFSEDASLQTRIRSYLDANCSSCHQKDGLKEVNLEFRYKFTKDIGPNLAFPGNSHASDPNRLVITPGDHSTSELWVRDNSLEENKMPPIGRNTVDQYYVDSLAKWIDFMQDDPTVYHSLLAYPNPTTGWLNIKVQDTWIPPYDIDIRSMSGHLLAEHKTMSSYYSLNLSLLSKGTYVLIIKDGTGAKEVERVVVI